VLARPFIRVVAV
ncbi:hypothetical protein BN1723_020060, partial [Verticillium longisporum]